MGEMKTTEKLTFDSVQKMVKDHGWVTVSVQQIAYPNNYIGDAVDLNPIGYQITIMEPKKKGKK
jgi:hypothetical protein